MAFVTAKYNESYTTNGVEYYDFKIAQHSADYHLKVTNAKNNWEKLDRDKKTVFAIVN